MPDGAGCTVAVNGEKPVAHSNRGDSVEFTVKPGVGVREGVVGSMFDKQVKETLVGGGHQVQFMQNTPFFAPDNFVIDPKSLRPIK